MLGIEYTFSELVASYIIVEKNHVIYVEFVDRGLGFPKIITLEGFLWKQV